MKEGDIYVFPATYLKNFAAEVFMHFGIAEADAWQASDVLSRSDLRGIDSHGVARLHTYFDMLELGRINPKPKIKIVREKATVATVDGDNGLGLVVGPKANDMALEKAARYGSGWVTVAASNHFGIAGYYPLQALKQDAIGWAMTNASPAVAPIWSVQRMLGTNPIAIAFPGLEEPAVVIDMATSAVAFGKIQLACYNKESIPDGWAINSEGGPVNDPFAFDSTCSLVPLGGDRQRGGHKGYCLASMVDVLCGVLSGAAWGPFAPRFLTEDSGSTRALGLIRSRSAR